MTSIGLHNKEGGLMSRSTVALIFTVIAAKDRENQGVGRWQRHLSLFQVDADWGGLTCVKVQFASGQGAQ